MELIRQIFTNCIVIGVLVGYIALTIRVFKIFDWSWSKIAIVLGWLLSTSIFLTLSEILAHNN